VTFDEAIQWLWENPMPHTDALATGMRCTIYESVRELNALIARQHRELHGKTPAESAAELTGGDGA
jgi:hypothetical protein